MHVEYKYDFPALFHALLVCVPMSSFFSSSSLYVQLSICPPRIEYAIPMIIHVQAIIFNMRLTIILILLSSIIFKQIKIKTL